VSTVGNRVRPWPGDAALGFRGVPPQPVSGPDDTDPFGPEWPAPCQGQEVLFFTQTDSRALRKARRICLTRCAHRGECLRLCYEPRPKWLVLQDRRTAQDHDRLGVDGFERESARQGPSSFGIWAGTSEADRKAVAHLSVPERIEVLLAWVASDVVGPSAPAKPHEVIREGRPR